MDKFLILGPMPQNALPERYFAAGPWCFAGQEELFPDWEKRFTFAPEPIKTTDRMRSAAKMAHALCIKFLPYAAKMLQGNYSGLEKIYWQTLLVPWCITVASQIVERLLRCRAMIDAWKNSFLTVPLLKNNLNFAFINEKDFNLRGALGIQFNWWLFSRLLEVELPEKWRVEYKEIIINIPRIEKQGVLPAFKSLLKNIFLLLPFPRLKGMNLFQSILFSTSLLHYCHQENHAFSIDREFYSDDYLQNFPNLDILLTILKKSLPESLKGLAPAPELNKCEKPKLRMASIEAYENCKYRKRLAQWRARGNRIAWAQHGGNYGQIAVACNSAIVEYPEDIFFTWGWKRQGKIKGNFQPMPYPQLQRQKNAWKRKTDKIIFVGTEMACFGYRLESRPTPLQFIKYREDKAIFLSGLPQKIRTNILYRPYFSLPGLLADGNWLIKKFPEVKICSGALLPQILTCSLLVLDHHGTTLLEALAANVPMVLYWDPKAWPLCEESEKALKELEKQEIWHDNPINASLKLLEVQQNPEKWWQSDSVQKCIGEYCKSYARTLNSGLNRLWLSELRKL